MIKIADVEILDTDKYGPVVRFRDEEVADQFEDFLTEKSYVLFQLSMVDGTQAFHFGQTSAIDNVRVLYERFSREVLANW